MISGLFNVARPVVAGMLVFVAARSDPDAKVNQLFVEANPNLDRGLSLLENRQYKDASDALSSSLYKLNTIREHYSESNLAVNISC